MSSLNSDSKGSLAFFVSVIAANKRKNCQPSHHAHHYRRRSGPSHAYGNVISLIPAIEITLPNVLVFKGKAKNYCHKN